MVRITLPGSSGLLASVPRAIVVAGTNADPLSTIETILGSVDVLVVRLASRLGHEVDDFGLDLPDFGLPRLPLFHERDDELLLRGLELHLGLLHLELLHRDARVVGLRAGLDADVELFRVIHAEGAEEDQWMALLRALPISAPSAVRAPAES